MGRTYRVDVTRPNKDTGIIKLAFCSAEKIVSDQLKINRSYREVNYSDMAKDIFAPLGLIGKKKIYTENTKNIGSLIVNNKSPIDALNTIAKVSRSSKYQGANYVFFEQSDGYFQFA